MTYPLVQFVSAPSLDAEVRFDCNAVGEWSDDDRWPEHDGFTLGFPSLSGDPEAIGVQYGTRSLEFNLIVRAAPDAAFNVFSRLSREVQRPRNWLMVQFSDFSKPVWFHTYRTEQQALDFENVSGVDDTRRNIWGIGVRLAADPFAQGEAVTLGPFVIGNQSTGPNQWHVTLPSVAGDAPAPVRMRVATSVNWAGFTPMFSTIALEGGTYDGSPLVFSLQGATAGTDAGAWVSSGPYPTGGYVPVSFTTNSSLITRVTDKTTVPPVGTYHVLIWAARATTDATFRLRGRHQRGSVDILGDSVDFDRAPSPSSGNGYWIDLGVFTFPTFASMEDRDLAYTQTTNFAVQIQRLSGTGALNVSALMYVPIDTPWAAGGTYLTAEFAGSGLPTADRSGEWDEDGNYQMLVTSALPARSVYDAAPPKPTGGPPILRPGCVNTMTVLQQTNCHSPLDPSNVNGDLTSATTTVTLDYAPRYLNLAGSEVL